MSISERIKEVAVTPKLRLCKLGVLLAGTILSEQDKLEINSVFDTESPNPAPISNVSLAKILREEGFDISVSAVDRHKRRTCGCYNLSVGN